MKTLSVSNKATVMVMLATMACTPNQVTSLCLLCEDGVNGLQYPDAVVKSGGTTCSNLALDVSVNFEDGSGECSQQIQAWREICCGDERPIDVDITDVLDQYPEINEAVVGPYEKCDVCRDGDFPSATGMVLTMLYIGSGSCAQFWEAGQQGVIPTHLCDPLQYFAYEPCGCGEFSTNNGNIPETYSGENDDNHENPWWSGADSGSGGDATAPPVNDDKWWSGADSGGIGGDQWWKDADSISSVANRVSVLNGMGVVLIAAVLVI